MHRAIVVTRNRVAAAAAVLAALTSAVCFVREPAGLAGLGLFMVPVTIVAAASWLAWYRPARREAMLTIDEEAVRADGVIFARRRWLRSATAARTHDGLWQIDLARWNAPAARVIVESAEAAREVLAALGFDRRAGTSRFRVRRASAPSLDATFIVTMTLMALALFSLAFVDSAAVLLLPLFFPLLAIVLAWPMTLTVGADGLGVGRRFLPYTSILHVGRRFLGRGRGLEIMLDGGEKIALDTTPELLRGGAVEDHVVTAVQQAWARARERGSSAGSALTRGDRTVREWIAALQTGGTGYRVAAVDDEELLSIVADVASPREVRVAAAVALASKPALAPRLRVATDDVADPVVRRIALTALDDEASLEEELAAAFDPK